MNPKEKRKKRIVRHRRVRAKVSGTAARPRLSVFRSHKNMFLQLIDDAAGRTLVSASTSEAGDVKGKGGRAVSAAKLLSERAAKAGIKTAVFDRGGYQYHGRVKSVADVMREAGLII